MSKNPLISFLLPLVSALHSLFFYSFVVPFPFHFSRFSLFSFGWFCRSVFNNSFQSYLLNECNRFSFHSILLVCWYCCYYCRLLLLLLIFFILFSMYFVLFCAAAIKLHIDKNKQKEKVNKKKLSEKLKINFILLFVWHFFRVFFQKYFQYIVGSKIICCKNNCI